jgi:hypothetical protein
MDSLYAEDEGSLRKPQLLFSHCGGKSRLASVASSLGAISIPVVIVADFDILNDEHLLKKTVESLGGDFEPMKVKRSQLDAALKSGTKPVSKTGMSEAITKALDGVVGPSITKDDAEALRALLRVESGWDKVKQAGLSAVPQGPAHQSCTELISMLKDVGIIVVPVGEVERFVPSVGGHGPKWVTAVHDKDLHRDPKNTVAREFLRDIVEATGSPRP